MFLIETALLKFLVKKNDSSGILQLPNVSSSTTAILFEKDILSANERVSKKLEVKKPTSVTRKVSTREKYNGYNQEQRAQIGKYATENGNTRVSRYFSTLWKINVPQSSVRRLKTKYFSKLKEVRARCDENEAPNVTSLPTNPQGRTEKYLTLLFKTT